MALTNAGFTVDAVCPSGHPLSKTRVARRTYGYKGLRPISSFAGAIAAARPELIVPGDDLATQHLHRLYQQQRSRGTAGAAVCALIEHSLGRPESFPVVFARHSSLERAREEEVRSPRTEVINSSDDLRRWANETGFPAVLKADGTSGGNGVRIVRTFEEAERAFRLLSAPPAWARAVKRTAFDTDSTLLWPSLRRLRSVVNVQEFVRGREATSAVACWKGAVVASLHFEVIEKAQRLGHATVVRVIENKEMSVAAERVVRGLGLSGLHGLDFMLGEDGRAHLIEINPRSTQIGHLTLGSGRDLPAALYSVVSGEVAKPAPRVTERNTIALFPQEWIRDPGSPFLSSGYHDVPWQEPDLVKACFMSTEKQRAWYAKIDESQVLKERSVGYQGDVRTPAGQNHSSSHATEIPARILCTAPRDLPPTKEPL